MGQQQLIYAFVARGTVVLAEYTEFTGNFTTIAAQCLQKLPASNNKFTYNCDGHTFNYLVEDGFSELLPLLLPLPRRSDPSIPPGSAPPTRLRLDSGFSARRSRRVSLDPLGGIRLGRLQ